MKKTITLAAYLAGATTLAVSLPAMADAKALDVTGLLGEQPSAVSAETPVQTRDSETE